MKKFTLLFALMASVLVLNAQNPMLPSDHGLPGNQPAWNQDLTQVQEFNCSEGFAWWSSYIDLSNDGLSMLENALGSNATIIKCNDAFNLYDEATGTWAGSLASLDNKMMYIIQIVSPQCLFQLEGTALNPEEVNIPINNGWNWVGYLNHSTVEVNAALADYTPSDDDQIKSQLSFATYYSSTGLWEGSLKQLEPGQGYLMLSHTSANTSFHYTGGSKSDEVTFDTPQTIWKVNPRAFAQNMTIIAKVNLQGNEVNNADYELGVFHGDECRGTTQLMYVESTKSYLAFLTAYGNEGDILQFRLLDRNNGTVFTTDNQQNITYSDNATLGQLRSPYPVEFKSILSAEETLAGMLSIFPNPVSKDQNLFVTLPENQTLTSLVTIQVVNLLGQVVREETMTSNTCSINGLASGIYTVRALADNSVIYNNKLIVR